VNTNIEQTIQSGVACIILNWKKPAETARCLTSVLSSSVLPQKIYVVDNNSQDESLTKIRDAIRPREDQGNRKYIENSIEWIEEKENLGYAAGNNAALRIISLDDSILYTWILNNDILVCGDTLKALYQAAQEHPTAGFIGTPVLYEDSEIIQCYGGGVNIPTLGLSRLLYKNLKFENLPIPARCPNYIMGCNMLIRSAVIKDIGLMDESFFMYSEEIDWQLRASKKGWTQKVATGSKVFHGKLSERTVRPASYYYYKNRASVISVKKNFGTSWAAISAIVHLAVVLLDKPTVQGITLGIKGLYHGITFNVNQQKYLKRQ